MAQARREGAAVEEPGRVSWRVGQTRSSEHSASAGRDSTVFTRGTRQHRLASDAESDVGAILGILADYPDSRALTPSPGPSERTAFKPNTLLLLF